MCFSNKFYSFGQDYGTYDFHLTIKRKIVNIFKLKNLFKIEN